MSGNRRNHAQLEPGRRYEERRIRLWLDGVLTVDYTEQDKSIPLQGLIGLQIHGGGKAEASYRDITIEELP